MIELQVENYCQDCRDFKAAVTPPCRNIPDWNGDVTPEWSNTVVRCEHRYRCENIVRYLKRTIKQTEE